MKTTITSKQFQELGEVCMRIGISPAVFVEMTKNTIEVNG